MAERNIEVQGIPFHVETKKLSGWHVFNLLKKAKLAFDDYEKVSALVEIACYITGLSEDEFVEKCGGEDAPIQVVVSIATELISEAYPKN